MSSFQPGIPTGFLNLDVDYKNIQDNFQQLDTTFGVGHTTYSNNTAQNGYHTNIQMIPNSNTTTNPPNNQPVIAPAAIAGYGQLFSAEINDGINVDEALYWLSGGNKLTQLTRNFTPVINASGSRGVTFLPGGYIFQWGFQRGTHGGGNQTFNPGDTGTITFSANTPNIAFPNNFFTAWTQMDYDSGIGVPASTSAFIISIDNGTQDKLHFDWAASGSGGSYTRFFWFALGN